MSKAMANASHCTGSERKSIANSPVNGEALSRLGNDSHCVAGKSGESKHRLLSCFSLCLVAFLLHYAWRRRAEGGQGAAPPTGVAALVSGTEELHLNLRSFHMRYVGLQIEDCSRLTKAAGIVSPRHL